VRSASSLVDDGSLVPALTMTRRKVSWFTVDLVPVVLR
jgi:hypothetical protein